MTENLDDEAIDDLLKRAGEGQEGDGGEVAFLRRYYRHVAPEDVLNRDAQALRVVADGHRQLAAHRAPGAALVQILSVDQGSTGDLSAIEIVTDDMPFIVDSVTALLTGAGIGIHLLLHPQFVVRRDSEGVLQELLTEVDPHDAPADSIIESWMRLEIDRISDVEQVEKLRQDVLRVLGDVRDAVEDWQRMRSMATDIADELDKRPGGVALLPSEEVSEGAEFLRWLADNRFTFLGYREYSLVERDGEDVLVAVPGTGLGILRADKPVSHGFGRLSEEGRAKAREPRLLVLTKANSRATVHRPTYMDYLGIKTFNDAGKVIGERRFLGLFTAGAYNESIEQIPALRHKAEQVLELSGFQPASHGGKDLMQVLETYPRDDMFQISVPELYKTALGVLQLQERRRVRLFLRRDDYGRFLSCLVYLPRDRYNTRVRLRMQEILLEALGGASIDYTLRVTESVLARVHFVVRVGEALPDDIDVAAIEQRLVEAARSWDDELAVAAAAAHGADAADVLLRNYTDAFPEGYKEDFSPATAVTDLGRLEDLAGGEPGAIALDFYAPEGAEPGVRHLKVYRIGPALSLSAVLPLLQNLGVEVTDERPFEIARQGDRAWIYDFGLRYTPSETADHSALKHLFEDAFTATWRGVAESDGFDALVLEVGLSWRQVVVLRAYAKYLRQAGTTFSQDYIVTTLRAQAPITKLLVQLFETRFDPGFAGDLDERSVRETEIVAEVEHLLEGVPSLDQDRILRSLLGLVCATLRTNFWQVGEDGAPKSYLSLKFASQQIADLPLPRPMAEIFVYSPRVEGVHLRYGKVARGGLRWSDRREDFRTEVLGLTKTQEVKNAVIVPVGSKGGFVVKQQPTDREALAAEVVACYRFFISGLLDLTDNLVDGTVVPPADVVRHDGDDTYLVVAADKGTARFSDIANGVSADYSFWLGDAFASGGSAGYDHKGMGITARGGWESVKNHFRHLGIDCQNEDFTCVGIGDMSGDVFGNGLLRSRHSRLIAAFDHRHIFIDPNPDAETSSVERQRLFDLPGSSWADYDPKLISAGGGVYARTLKSIELSPEAREALGIEAEELSPAELMSAVLKAPVDLLWNGGIGTYVKSHAETNAEVGDKANDAVRVDGRDLRARIVGEGGNLGFTQLGRIEYALNGGLLNTDAIDNSAGVDTSDHEVNIKIMLSPLVRSGAMTLEQRNELLAEMTDEVAELVLWTNYEQNIAIDCSEAQAPGMLHVHASFMEELERAGKLNRVLERLPGAEEIAARRSAGIGLTRPELAVLLAYAKITLAERMLDSGMPEDPFLERELVAYFPSPLRERFAEEMRQHPLRREIIVTRVVNRMVNELGITFAHRVANDTAADPADVARAYAVAQVIYDLDSFRRDVEALDNVVPSGVQVDLLLEGRRLAERVSRWLLSNRRMPIDIQGSIDFFAAGVAAVAAELPGRLVGADAQQWTDRAEALIVAGVPEPLAHRVAGMPALYSALSIIDVATVAARPLAEVAEVYFDLADRLHLARVRDLVVALPRDTRWDAMARAALRDDLYAAHAELTSDVLLTTDVALPVPQRIEAWLEKNGVAVNRGLTLLEETLGGDRADLATLSVAMREIRAMVRAASL